MESNSKIDQNKLRIYYDHFFPFDSIFNWLNIDSVDVNDFKKREFTFITNDGTFVRYLSFENAKSMKLTTCKKIPIRVEIGPIYNEKPNEKDTATDFKPMCKELVFDIDVSDYNEIRTCCINNAICEDCWEFMNCTIEILDIALKNDFGFKKLLWTFSGRRGIHCWVSDKRAKKLSNEERYAIGRYFSIFDKNQGKTKDPFTQPHRSILRAFNISKPYFLQLAKSQKWFTDEKFRKRFLEFIPNEFSSLKKKLAEKWSIEELDEIAKFQYLADFSQNPKNFKGKLQYSQLRLQGAIHKMVLYFTYPRLDIEVTRKLNHLLKSPFVIHPSTGIVCVPIHCSNRSDFNPLHLKQLPTLETLHKDFNGNGQGVLSEFKKCISRFDDLLKRFSQ